MKNETKSTHNKEAAEILEKLLDAAGRARDKGKYLALGKILDSAKKLSNKVKEDIKEARETMQTRVKVSQESEQKQKRIKSYVEFFRNYRFEKKRKTPPSLFENAIYKKVDGEIVE